MDKTVTSLVDENEVSDPMSLAEKPEETVSTTNNNIEDKVEAIESIADTPQETEMEIPVENTNRQTNNLSEKFETPVSTFDTNNTNTQVAEEKKEDNKQPSDSSSNKLWSLAVIGSILILIASAAGMVYILMQG